MNTEDKLIWDRALLLPQKDDLALSFSTELQEYFSMSKEQVESAGAQAIQKSKVEWESKKRSNKEQITEFYKEYADYIFEEASLHYLYRRTDLCLEILSFIKKIDGIKLLDYGSGIGTIALFFSSQGYNVTLADISKPMQDFCKWRFKRRGRDASFIDLRTQNPGEQKYDFIITFDVFEHLADPATHLRKLSHALKAGGLLIIEAAFGKDADRPMHIGRDSRSLDLAPLFGLKAVNFSPYSVFKQPRLVIFEKTVQPLFPRFAAISLGLFRYALKVLKNR